MHRCSLYFDAAWHSGGETQRMQVAALFAGIGGLELGLEASGHRTVLTCEIAPAAMTVLGRHFPDSPNEADVRVLEALPRGIEVLTAGFPCQDLSQAGTTSGIGGKKSGLVAHVLRLLDSHRVPVVVLENVSFMLQLEQGAAMHTLAHAFEERGYRWAYRTVNSLGFLAQRRKRVFFVASRGDVAPERVLFADHASPIETHTPLTSHAHGFYWTEGTRGLGWADDAIPTLKNGSTIGIPSPPAILMPDGRIIKPDIRDAERLQGFPEDWTAGVDERLRWALVGNAVTVPVAAWLGGRLAQPGTYGADLDMAWTAQKAWPRSARYDGSARHAVRASEYPVWTDRAPLHTFLRHDGVLLSERATASPLRFVPGFLDAVRLHLERVRAGTDLEVAVGRPRRAGGAPALRRRYA